MAEWLDRWAKRAANVDGADAQAQISSSAAEPSASRRDFLKKAGIVGGVAWSIPVMQTVMAPAASASPNTALGGNCAGTPPNSGPGSNCATNNAICSPTNICGGIGASCAAGKACFSSNCSGSGGTQPFICGGKGASCTTNSQCLSNNCNGGSNKCQ